MKKLFSLLMLFISITLVAQNKTHKQLQDSLIKLPVTRYTDKDTFVIKKKTIRLIKWVVINKRYYWKCSDGRYYPDILIDDYKK